MGGHKHKLCRKIQVTGHSAQQWQNSTLWRSEIQNFHFSADTPLITDSSAAQHGDKFVDKIKTVLAEI